MPHFLRRIQRLALPRFWFWRRTGYPPSFYPLILFLFSIVTVPRLRIDFSRRGSSSPSLGTDLLRLGTSSPRQRTVSPSLVTSFQILGTNHWILGARLQTLGIISRTLGTRARKQRESTLCRVAAQTFHGKRTGHCLSPTSVGKDKRRGQYRSHSPEGNRRRFPATAVRAYHEMVPSALSAAR